jgi:PAS domain S-box-containing protein
MTVQTAHQPSFDHKDESLLHATRWWVKLFLLFFPRPDFEDVPVNRLAGLYSDIHGVAIIILGLLAVAQLILGEIGNFGERVALFGLFGLAIVLRQMIRPAYFRPLILIETLVLIFLALYASTWFGHTIGDWFLPFVCGVTYTMIVLGGNYRYHYYRKNREWDILRFKMDDAQKVVLQRAEARWKFAIEGAGYGLWDWNIQTGHAFYSPRYKEMLGFEPQDIGETAEEWSKRIHPDDAPSVKAALQPFMDGKPGAAAVEFRMLRKDGIWQWTLGRGMVVERDSDGNPLRMIGTNTDITERKQFISQLEAAKDDLQATLDASPDWVFDIGLDGRFHSDHSVRPEALIGTKQTLVGKLVSEVMPADAASVIMATLQEASAIGHSRGKQFALTLPQTHQWFELSAALKAIHSDDVSNFIVKVPRFIVILRDVTQRRQQEQERLDLANRVEELSREKIRTTERGRILRNMHDGVGSHISSAIRQLQMQPESNVVSNSGEVLQTLRDALDHLKLSVDSIHWEPGDVGVLLANLRYRLGPRFASMNIQMQWDVDPLPVCISLDSGAMSQLQFILFEALSNVIQHAGATVLKVEGCTTSYTDSNASGNSQHDKKRVVLRLVDDGHGFDATQRSGSGNGLVIMAERALAIGAQLSISSAPGRTMVEIAIDV